MKLLVVLFFSLVVSPAAFASETGGSHQLANVNPLIIIPFAVLLLSIALLPLINKHWWEEKYPYFAFLLGGIVILYYLVLVNDVTSLMHTGLEYFSFVSLVGSLYVITGCILLKVDRKSTPLLNCAILLFGSVFANIVGTTGASVFLIRAYIKINRKRLRPYHIVFFIFLISNIGGALTPIGDPPLFLGYLKGVPFFWTLEKVWHIWAFAVLALIGLFYLIDSRNYAKNNQENDSQYSNKIVVEGKRNFIYLGAVLGAVFLQSPLREIVMLGAAAIAYKNCKKYILKANDFNFEPIREVAILFFGIFSCMIPALQWLEANAGSLGIQSAGQFYWGTGLLSGILDNAPTYLNFLSAAFGIHNLEMSTDMMVFVEEQWKLLQAISVAAVFFGAMTYIGNAPNFMIKSISEQSKAEVPTFVGYIGKYSIPILLPLFFVVWLIFFR